MKCLKTNSLVNDKTNAGLSLFHNADPYHIENTPLICKANQWTGLHMIGTSVMKELSFVCCLL